MHSLLNFEFLNPCCTKSIQYIRFISYSLAELIVLWPFNIQNWFICSFIKNWIAYANEANIVNKDSPILYTFGKHSEFPKRQKKNWLFFSTSWQNRNTLPFLFQTIFKNSKLEPFNYLQHKERTLHFVKHNVLRWNNVYPMMSWNLMCTR